MRKDLALYLFVNVAYLWMAVMSIEIISKDKLDIKFINFYHKPGLVLLDSLVKKVEATDALSCQFHCVNHQSCLSVNFGKKSNQTFCELNNSTSLAKPVKMRKRKGFDFYGPADPCFSNPCLNGGTCTSNMADQGSYKCDCGHQAVLLPYVNDHCEIDKSTKSKLTRYKVYSGVFHLYIRPNVNVQYPWNYFDAKRVCEIFGAGLANLQQLTAAWKIGYDSCSWGWLIDGTVRYPIFTQRSNEGCGGTGPASIRGHTSLSDKANRKAGAYCYIETDRCNEEDWYQHAQKCYKFFLDSTASWNDATRTCAEEGGMLGSVKSKAKLLFVKDFVERQKSSHEQVMVGLRQDSGGTWKWNDGNTVDSSLWNITQPSGPIGTVDVRSASLNNVPENDKLPFVCQKDIQE